MSGTRMIESDDRRSIPISEMSKAGILSTSRTDYCDKISHSHKANPIVLSPSVPVYVLTRENNRRLFSYNNGTNFITHLYISLAARY